MRGEHYTRVMQWAAQLSATSTVRGVLAAGGGVVRPPDRPIVALQSIDECFWPAARLAVNNAAAAPWQSSRGAAASAPAGSGCCKEDYATAGKALYGWSAVPGSPPSPAICPDQCAGWRRKMLPGGGTGRRQRFQERITAEWRTNMATNSMKWPLCDSACCGGYVNTRPLLLLLLLLLLFIAFGSIDPLG